MAHVCNKSPACIHWALCSKIQKYYTSWHHEKAATVCHAVSEQGLDGSGLPSSHSNLLLKGLRTWICNFNRTCKMSYEGLVILVIHYVSCCMFSVLNLTLPDSCVPLYIYCFIYSTPVSSTELHCPPYFITPVCVLLYCFSPYIRHRISLSTILYPAHMCIEITCVVWTSSLSASLCSDDMSQSETFLGDICMEGCPCLMGVKDNFCFLFCVFNGTMKPRSDMWP